MSFLVIELRPAAQSRFEDDRDAAVNSGPTPRIDPYPDPRSLGRGAYAVAPA